ncbi:MAG: bifunctional histidinol-phosphatase/imidazoleglycerol-phosphate dehydratase HisB [Gammaproteobacteria bacterium]
MSQAPKTLFIDRDGTLIIEPEDKQVDSCEKLGFIPDVMQALLQLQAAGFSLVIVTNQNGIGSKSFPEDDFWRPQNKMMDIFTSQGITFSDVLVCPHLAEDHCECRKPKTGMVKDYITERKFDLDHSYVIGDRETDLQLAQNMGIRGYRIGAEGSETWSQITRQLLAGLRRAHLKRKTKETDIEITVDLDQAEPIVIATGIGFFDHMLAQLAQHGGFNLRCQAQGDLHIDEHHLVEDTALVLGGALRKALGEKIGIARYGFLLPMDEALAQVAIDLSGRPYCKIKADLKREKIGEFPTELVDHFFQSFAQALGAAIHIEVEGDNAHHMVEAMFKSVGRALRQAFSKQGEGIASTKGVL